MPSYTTSLRLVQPATGEYSGTWGTQVNNGITALVDTSVAGTASITMTAADYTLSTANGATDEARAMFLVLGGTPGAARNVICPAVSKLYYVTNNTTGGFAQTVKTSAGTGISVPNGASMVLRCDGTNVVEAQNSLGSIVLNGGTANGVAYLNASKALTTGSALVFDGTNFSTTGTATATKLIPTGGSATGNGMYLPAANTLAWSTNGAETMRLDSSGNLGLGVTPSAWGGGFRALQIYGRSSIASDNANRLWLNSDCYNNGTNWLYGASGVQVSQYRVWNGEHAWFTAPSGTAGAAISFTQVMTLDASGNLLVGTTANPGILNRSVVVDSGASALAGFVMQNDTTGRTSTDGGALLMNGAEMRLTNYENNSMLFSTNNTERARITSGGDFLVGTTTASGVGNSIFGSSVPGVIHQNNNAAANGFVFTSYRRSSVEIGSVSQNGTTAVLFNTTSDRRLKENIVPAPSASDVIDAIEIVSHDWKSAPDEHVTYGVIAQDLALVAPQAVLQGDDSDEIKKTWGVDYSKLVPMLIKEIQTLRARVAALEQA